MSGSGAGRRGRPATRLAGIVLVIAILVVALPAAVATALPGYRSCALG